MKKISFFTIFSITTSIATILTAIFAGVGLYSIKIANDTFTETKNTNQGNFILNLNRDFYFNDKLSAIRNALEENQPILKDNGGQFSSEDLDSYLGFLDTLSEFTDNNILDYSYVDDNFGYYIKQAYDNKEIKSYIAFVQKKYGKDLYVGFQLIGSEMSKEGY